MALREGKKGAGIRRVSSARSRKKGGASLVDVFDGGTGSTVSLANSVGFPSLVQGDGDEERESLRKERRSAKKEIRESRETRSPRSESRRRSFDGRLEG